MAIQTTGKCCPICGKDVAEPNFKRLGEWACSEGRKTGAGWRRSWASISRSSPTRPWT